jgi:crotonobetainyl-CoA:carnitine CoA-transferase CaiB-like acyl-CoA transferase
LCSLIGRGAWAQDSRFRDAGSRRAHHDAIDEVIQAWTATQDATAAVAALQQTGIPAGVVANARDLVEDPHLRARGWLREMQGRHPGTYPGLPIRFLVGGGGAVHSCGPDLGQHNREVLVERLGLPEAILPKLDPSQVGTAFDLE